MTTQPSIIRRLFTALRGGLHEAGEAIEETQQLRILDQEIRDAGSAVSQAEQSLTQIMAKEKLAKNRVSELSAKIVELEGHAVACLNAGNEALALETANRISDLTNQRDEEQRQVEEFTGQIVRMQAEIAKARSNIQSMRRQVDRVKARESVQKAQVAVARAGGNANGKLSTAASTLARINARQEETAASLEAQEELAAAASGDDLERKLRDAKIIPSGTSGESILDKLRNRDK
jgi:phage shock protein A